MTPEEREVSNLAKPYVLTLFDKDEVKISHHYYYDDANAEEDGELAIGKKFKSGLDEVDAEGRCCAFYQVSKTQVIEW